MLSLKPEWTSTSTGIASTPMTAAESTQTNMPAIVSTLYSGQAWNGFANIALRLAREGIIPLRLTLGGQANDPELPASMSQPWP